MISNSKLLGWIWLSVWVMRFGLNFCIWLLLCKSYFCGEGFCMNEFVLWVKWLVKVFCLNLKVVFVIVFCFLKICCCGDSFFSMVMYWKKIFIIFWYLVKFWREELVGKFRLCLRGFFFFLLIWWLCWKVWVFLDIWDKYWYLSY